MERGEVKSLFKTWWSAQESFDVTPGNQTELSNLAGIKLLNIVSSTSLFSPTISMSLLNEAEINNMLNQKMLENLITASEFLAKTKRRYSNHCFHLPTFASPDFVPLFKSSFQAPFPSYQCYSYRSATLFQMTDSNISLHSPYSIRQYFGANRIVFRFFLLFSKFDFFIIRCV